MRVVSFYHLKPLTQILTHMKSTENNNAIVLCRSFYDDIAANLAAVALRDHDIPCTIDNQVFSSVYPLGMSALGALRLMVFKKDLEKAREIIASLHIDCY